MGWDGGHAQGPGACDGGRDVGHGAGVGGAGVGYLLGHDGQRLAALVLQDGAPEQVLGAVLSEWLGRGAIGWGSIFLKRPGGWVRLAERPSCGEVAARYAADCRRMLARDLSLTSAGLDERAGEIVQSDGPGQDPVAFEADARDPAIEGRLFGYPLGPPQAECGRLVLAPYDPSQRMQLPLALSTLLALFLNRLPVIEEQLGAAIVLPRQRRVTAGASISQPAADPAFPEIIGTSPELQSVLRLIQQAAPSEASIVIHGESGTGKELVARAIHRLSPRKTGPFIGENCAAFSESLLESEIFGSEKGAFTGSTQTRAGLMERAHGGTLFLDEIAEMSLSLQAKLLRALQEREVRRVGGSRMLPVDFRLITATHRDLDREVAAGRFRADLLFRIHVFRVPLPPLRDRCSDIPLLVQHFLSEMARRRALPDPEIDAQALSRLMHYEWPGNVRELRNELERSFILSPDRLTVDSLSDRLLAACLPSSLARRVRVEMGNDLRGLERRVLGGIIREVLDETGGNKAEAARILGLPKTSLYRRMVWYGLEDGEAARDARF